MTHLHSVSQFAWLFGFLSLALVGCTAGGGTSSHGPAAPPVTAPDASFVEASTPPSAAPVIFGEADFDEMARQAVERDGFPVLDQPDLVGAEAADEELDADDPVIGVFIGGEAHAYPISVMGGHELINDVCGDVPIAVSW